LATVTNDDVDEIRRQMAQIRLELHQDVKEVVAGAEAVADWRRFIRMYPWASVAVAAAAGYLVIPRRHRKVPRNIARASDLAEVTEQLRKVQENAPVREESKRRKSLVGAAFGMLVPLAWRVAQNYAMGYLEQWIARQQQQAMAVVAPPTAPRQSPGHPGGPRPY